MKYKTFDEIEKSLKFYRVLIYLILGCSIAVVWSLCSDNDLLTRQLTAQVKAHQALTLKYDTLNYDVVQGSCLLRSQL